jgi:predicted Holliday junction resolvase-like endonuclease
MSSLPWAVLLAMGAIIGAVGGALLMWIRAQLALRDAVSTASRRSVEQSRSTLKGQIAAQKAPMLRGFPYHPADARFLGDPVDYIVFNGYTQVKDDGAEDEALEIVIVDIKRGSSKLSRSQQRIARAVADGRVRFEVIRIDDRGRVSCQLART